MERVTEKCSYTQLTDLSGVREGRTTVYFPISLLSRSRSLSTLFRLCMRYGCDGIFQLARGHGSVFRSQISSNNHFHYQSCHMLPLTKLQLPLLTQVTFNRNNSMVCSHTVLNVCFTLKTNTVSHSVRAVITYTMLVAFFLPNAQYLENKALKYKYVK